jgi:hypothetical protein
VKRGEADGHDERTNQSHLAVVRPQKTQRGATDEEHKTADLKDRPELLALGNGHRQRERNPLAAAFEIDAVRIASRHCTPVRRTHDAGAFVAVDRQYMRRPTPVSSVPS